MRCVKASLKRTSQIGGKMEKWAFTAETSSFPRFQKKKKKNTPKYFQDTYFSFSFFLSLHAWNSVKASVRVYLQSDGEGEAPFGVAVLAAPGSGPE